jgi:hypothetical protein
MHAQSTAPAEPEIFEKKNKQLDLKRDPMSS